MEHRRKGFWLLGIIGLLIIAGVAVGNDDDDDQVAVAGAVEERVFAGRPDAQPGDQELRLGQDATLPGSTATVTAATFQQSVTPYYTHGYVVIDVSVVNGDDAPQPYSHFDWRLRTPQGDTLEPANITTRGELGHGHLMPGGRVTGQVVFEVGAVKGEHFIIWKPGPLRSGRGIWAVTI